VTAGFYSKDLILWDAWSSPSGSPWLWAAGLVGALLTSLYTFRMVFITFFGDAKQEVHKKPGLRMQIPLIVLGVLSVVGGFVELPDTLGNLSLFTNFMHTALPAAVTTSAGVNTELILQLVAAVVSLAGVLVAYLLFLREPRRVASLVQTSWGTVLHRLWFAGWGFDWLYGTLIVRPFVWLARINKGDVIDLIYQGIAWLSQALHYLLSLTQTGKVRWYAMGIAVGAVVTIAIVVFL